MQAVEYLERLTKLDYLIGNKLAEQKEYEYLAEELGEEFEPLNLNQYVKEQQEIIRILEELPTRYYIVLYKYYHEKKKLREIAEELDMSLKGVMNRKADGTKALQKLLDERNCK